MSVRVRHRQGELLRTRDLQADVDAEAHARARHVIGAHRTAGVALGFLVAVVDDIRGVLVTPGLAYTRCGDEIVSSRTVFLPPPQFESSIEATLVVSAGPCWAWRTGEPLRDEIALARYRIDQNGFRAADISVRRAARGLQPRLATGAEEITLPLATLAYNSVWVSTESAGFGDVPFYFVTVAEPNQGGMLGFPAEAFRYVRGPFLRVRDQQAGGFQLDVRLSNRSIGFGDPVMGFSSLPDQVVLTVNWLAVLQEPAYAPPADTETPDSPWNAPLPLEDAFTSLTFAPVPTPQQTD